MCTRESHCHEAAAKSNDIYVHVGEMKIASVHCLVGSREYQPQKGVRVGGGRRGKAYGTHRPPSLNVKGVNHEGWDVC